MEIMHINFTNGYLWGEGGGKKRDGEESFA